MITCRQARRWMERAFDGRIAVDQNFLLEEHALECPRCRAELASQSTLVDGLASLHEGPAERVDVEAALARIHAELDADPHGAPIEAEGPRHLRRVAAAAIALAAAGALIHSLTQGGRPEGETGAVAEESLTAPDAVPDALPPLDDQQDALAVESVPPIIVHPLLPANSEVDFQLHARVEAEVRRILLAAAEVHLFAEKADVDAFIAAVEEQSAPLLEGDWPFARLVADDVHASDPVLARAASRYTGRRATRLGVARLEDALQAPQDMAVKRDLTLALIDAQGLGRDGLQRAFWDAQLCALVRTSVDTWEPEERYLWAAATLWFRRAEGEGVEACTAAWIELVAGCGAGGAELLLDQVTDTRLPRAEVLRGLALCADGPRALRDRLSGRVRMADVPALLDAVAALQPDGSYRFVWEEAWSGQHRQRAACVLANFPGVQPLYALLQIDEGRRLDDEGLALAWHAALEADAARATTLALETIARGDTVSARRVLEALTLAEHASAVPAMIELATRGPLRDADRERAFLIVAELGAAEHVPALERSFRTWSPRDRARAAACLLALHRLGGSAAVERLLGAASERNRERVMARLEGSPRATSLLLLARELEPVLATHEALTWRDER